MWFHMVIKSRWIGSRPVIFYLDMMLLKHLIDSTIWWQLFPQIAKAKGVILLTLCGACGVSFQNQPLPSVWNVTASVFSPMSLRHRCPRSFLRHKPFRQCLQDGTRRVIALLPNIECSNPVCKSALLSSNTTKIRHRWKFSSIEKWVFSYRRDEILLPVFLPNSLEAIRVRLFFTNKSGVLIGV
jgi:hypothetical protein